MNLVPILITNLKPEDFTPNDETVLYHVYCSTFDIDAKTSFREWRGVTISLPSGISITILPNAIVAVKD